MMTLSGTENGSGTETNDGWLYHCSKQVWVMQSLRMAGESTGGMTDTVTGNGSNFSEMDTNPIVVQSNEDKNPQW